MTPALLDPEMNYSMTGKTRGTSSHWSTVSSDKARPFRLSHQFWLLLTSSVVRRWLILRRSQKNTVSKARCGPTPAAPLERIVLWHFKRQRLGSLLKLPLELKRSAPFCSRSKRAAVIPVQWEEADGSHQGHRHTDFTQCVNRRIFDTVIRVLWNPSHTSVLCVGLFSHLDFISLFFFFATELESPNHFPASPLTHTGCPRPPSGDGPNAEDTFLIIQDVTIKKKRNTVLFYILVVGSVQF